MARRFHVPAIAWLCLAAAAVVSIDAADTLVGCYLDGPRRSLSSQLIQTGGQLTVKACSDAAKARGQPVFAVARGNECWIGEMLMLAGTGLIKTPQPSQQQLRPGCGLALPAQLPGKLR